MHAGEDVELTKRYYVHTTTATAITKITSTTITNIITTKAKSITVEISGNVEGDVESNQSTLYVYRLSNGWIRYISAMP